MKSHKHYYLLLTTAILLLFISNIFFGAITISPKDILEVLLGGGEERSTVNIIILNSRLPQAITALLTGLALGVSGLMLQTLFSNALASPSIMGISSGAGLGVAIVMLLLGGNISTFGLTGQVAVVIGSLIGALVVLFAILFFSVRVKNSVMLLIIGIMVGYVASSAISLLSYLGTTEGVYTFVMWGMGDFSSVTLSNMPFFVLAIMGALILSFMLVKPLNGLLLGEGYCANIGINVKRARLLILLSTGVLTAIVTAYCGPVSFIGLVAPHLARLMLGVSNHRVLLPITALMGALIALLCQLLSVTLVDGVLIPLNVITPCLGAPVIIYVIVNRNNIPYFK